MLCRLGKKKKLTCRVGWGKISMVGQSRSLGILGTHSEKIHILTLHLNRKAKLMTPVIISSLQFTPETKMSSDLLCPTIGTVNLF